MLRAAHSLDHVVCSSALEAGVLEARLLGRLAPRYNRHGTRWRSYRYVRLTNQRVPRLAVVRAPRRDGAQYLGPLVSTRVARMVVEAIETAVPLRPPAKGNDIASPAVGGLATHPEVAAEGLDGDDRALGGEHRLLLHPGDAELHVAGPVGPLAEGFAGRPSQIDEAVHRQLAQTVVRGFTDRPDLLLEPLRERIDHLTAVGRADEAQIVRDRYTALARALRRQRRFATLRQAGRITVDLPGGGGAELNRGRLLRAWGPDGPSTGPSAPLPGGDRLGLEPVEIPPDEGPVPCDLADEMHYVAAWLERHASRVRIVDVEGTFASPLPPIDVAPPRRQGPEVPDAPPPRAGLDPATAEASGDWMAAV
jgi:DNA polymerase-3 subunit epsilon